MRLITSEARVFLRRWISVLMSLAALEKCPYVPVGTEEVLSSS